MAVNAEREFRAYDSLVSAQKSFLKALPMMINMTDLYNYIVSEVQQHARGDVSSPHIMKLPHHFDADF